MHKLDGRETGAAEPPLAGGIVHGTAGSYTLVRFRPLNLLFATRRNSILPARFPIFQYFHIHETARSSGRVREQETGEHPSRPLREKLAFDIFFYFFLVCSVFNTQRSGSFVSVIFSTVILFCSRESNYALVYHAN